MNPTNTPANRGSDPFVRQLGALGKRMRAIRRDRGWSQDDLATRTGIGRAKISGIEAGRQNLTVKVLWRLASALEVHWADLLDDRIAAVPRALDTMGPFEQQLATFGTRVYQARVLQRVSQQALTGRTGIGRSAISEIEDGRQNVTLRTLSVLAVGVGLHWADLVDDRHGTPPQPDRARTGGGDSVPGTADQDEHDRQPELQQRRGRRAPS